MRMGRRAVCLSCARRARIGARGWPAPRYRGERMDRGGVIYAALVSCAGVALAGALAFPGPGGRRAAPAPGGGGGTDATTASFVNWETGQVHPVDMTPDGTRLLVCNTADNRLEVFD